MDDLFTLQNLLTLLMLVLLQAVLGFDNLLYISIESKRVEESQQAKVRRLGIGLAIALRIILLVVVVNAISAFQDPWFSIHIGGLINGEFNLESLVFIVGGGFIIYTAVKEIAHMLSIEHLEGHPEEEPRRPVATAVTWIVIMNLVFSFDSILSARALSDSLVVMATAIVISGVMMIFLSDHVSEFLKKNRMYEVLGLFVLFLVGVMLLSEGGHVAELAFAGHPVNPMHKSTFYFVLGVLVIVDVLQSRYQKKLTAERQAEQTKGA